jgi:hypothetical protein
MSLDTLPEDVRREFVREWLACTLRTYPDQAGRFLREERDPFRNPVGSAFSAAFEALAEELFGRFDRARVSAALDGVVRVRAVQGFTPAEAVAFVPMAGDVLPRAALGPSALALVESRIGEMSVLAAEALSACRDQIREIGARAARRRVFVPERAQAWRERRDAALSAPRGNTA